MNHKNEVHFDPKGDPELVKQIQSMMARGGAYQKECQRQGVKFLPKQVMRPVLARLGIADGPMIKPRSDEFLVVDLQD